VPRSGHVSKNVPVIGGGIESTVAISTHGATTEKRVTGAADATHQPNGLETVTMPTAGNKTAAEDPHSATLLEAVRARAGAADGEVSDKLTSLTGAAAENTAWTDARHGSEPKKASPEFSTHLENVGPPMPLLPASTAMPPGRGQSKIVIAVVAVFVALALFIGYHGLFDTNSSPALSKPTSQHRAPVSAPPVTTPASRVPPAANTTTGPIAIQSATGFDPEGDHQENNALAPLVYDGNPATTWTSELYTTAQFGNLKKGVGLLLDLGQPKSVHQVTIDLGNGPLDVTFYAATGPSLTGATVIDAASAASGRIQLKAATSMPKSQFVIVWFTRLAPLNGQFGAAISEIALS
jgi:hypothetical protein